MKITITSIRNYLNACTEPPEVISITRVRNVLRGYRIMRMEGKHNLINVIRAQLTETELKVFMTLPLSSFILINDEKLNELSYRQYLLVKLIGTRLNGSILSFLYNKKSIAFPLPKEWRNVLESNDIKMNHFLNHILFNIFATKQFALAFVTFFKININNLIFLLRKKSNAQPYIYFFDLQHDCIPPLDGSFRYNIFEWYLNWEGRERNISQIRHSLQIEDRNYKGVEILSDSYLPKIKNVLGVFIYFYWSLTSLIFSFIYLIIGFPKFAILLSEIQKAKLFELADKSEIAKDYLYNNNNMIYRPIWTYAAEKKGAKVILYNWSAGFPDILGPHGYPPPGIGQTTQNWPIVLQWSPLYTEFLRTIIKNKDTQVREVPPIHYSDIEPIEIKSTKPIISVFDVTPQKSFFHAILAPSVEYRTYLIGKHFLEEIYELCQKHGFDILWKRKRDFILNHSKAYVKFCDKFVQQPGIIEINPRSSAFYLVKQCVASISMPFTSTALVAKSFNIPSIYFDPTKRLFKSDRGAQGIPFMIGKEELESWMLELKISLQKSSSF